MTYSKHLRELFPDISLHAEDLLWLETFQIKYLPDRVAAKEFAILLHTYPVVHRYLLSRHPPLSEFLDPVMETHKPGRDESLVHEQCQEALWEIADLIIYNKYPEQFDKQGPIHWEPEEITSMVSLEGKVMADVGAGSGRIAFLLAPRARIVFAVEPASSLRSYMKDKAARDGADNLYVMDGTLDSIPLPDGSLDVLITSNAIGWNLQEELREIERVVKPGGTAIHLLWSRESYEIPFHPTLTSPPWNYTCVGDMENMPLKLLYTKAI